MNPIANLLTEIQADIQQAANERAERFRPAPDKPPVLDVDVLCDLLMKSAETAEICWTDKSRENRKRVLIQAGSLALLALFEMRRGEVSDRSDTFPRKQDEDLRVQLDAAKELLAAVQPIVEAAEALVERWKMSAFPPHWPETLALTAAVKASRSNRPHVSDRSDAPGSMGAGKRAEFLMMVEQAGELPTSVLAVPSCGAWVHRHGTLRKVSDRLDTSCTCPPGTWKREGAVGAPDCPMHGDARDGMTTCVVSDRSDTPEAIRQEASETQALGCPPPSSGQ